MKTDLYDYLKKDKTDSQNLYNNYNNLIKTFKSINSAIQFVHNKNFVYNDLKLENIMVSFDNKIKLIDFNCLFPIESTYSKNCNLQNNFTGTIDFLPPEIFVILKKNNSEDQVFYNYNQLDFKTDVWSFGIVLYEFLTKSNFPYIIKGNRSDTINNIKNNIFNDSDYAYLFFKKKIENVNINLDDEQKNIVCNLFVNCFKTDPIKRIIDL